MESNLLPLKNNLQTTYDNRFDPTCVDGYFLDFYKHNVQVKEGMTYLKEYLED
jgi:hypothetical protein